MHANTSRVVLKGTGVLLISCLFTCPFLATKSVYMTTSKTFFTIVCCGILLQVWTVIIGHCPERDVKLDPHGVKFYGIGCVRYWFVFVKPLT